jgi:hypothetical protein
MYRSVTTFVAVALSAAFLFTSCDSSSGGGKGEQIVVTAPAAGSKYVGGLDTITVSFRPAMSGVTVEFNYNDIPGLDAQYETVSSVVVVDQNTVKFVPPRRNMSDSATVRISDSSSDNTAGVSAPFKVKHIVLSSPADGSTQSVGVPIYVQWRCNQLVTGVDVLTSVDLGENWVLRDQPTQVSPTDTTWENFPVTFAAATSNALVKVKLYTNDAVFDENVQPFSVQ